MIHKRLLLLFFVLAGTLTAIAQEHSYRHYSVQDGLVQSQVLSIFQDSKGFLWVGTKGGVSRFDGKNFLNFTSKDGLPDNQVYKITEDYQGIIWFLTQDGLAKFDGNQLTAYPTKHFKPSSSFVIFCETKPGELLIVFHRFKQEVFFLSFSNGEYKVLPSVYHEKMLDPETYSILGEYDSVEKAIWLAIPTSQLIKIKNNQITYLPVSTKLPQGLKLGNDGKLYLMDDGKVYVNSNDSIIHIATANTLNFSLNNISNFEVDKKGVIYLYNKHLFLYRNKSWEKEYFNFNNVIVIYIDNEDNLWIGSETGLYRLISRAFVNFIPEKCGINHLIWSIAEDKNGRIKFASYEYGLQDFDGKKIVNDKSFENLVIGEKNYFYMGSIVDNEKNILFTSAPAGGLKYDGKKFSRIFPDTTTIATFIFYEDPDNFDLLAGTNRGLFIKSKSKGLINQHITPGNGRSNFIVSIVKDKYKRYWLGGFKGISLLDGKDVIHLPTPEMTFEEGGNAMLVDSLQNIWIGNSEGLYFYDYKSFRQIEDQSLNSMITSLSMIGDSTLIIGSVTGLALLDLNAFYRNDTIKMTVFNKETGFQGIEVGQNGIFKDSKGQYWIPTSDRVVRFNPYLYKKNTKTPSIFITNVSLLSDKMEWNKIERAEFNVDSYQFSSKQKNLRFEYSGISLSHPEGVKYSHFLEGYDNGWSDPELNNYSVYTNLGPGDYKLMVKACNSDGVWSDNYASFTFRIVPAFYQSHWFWIICFFLTAGAFVYLGAFYMNRKKRKREEILETEKRMAELRLLTVQNQMEPHFTFNAMNSIAAFILKKDNAQAYNYFVKLSKLIRSSMRSSESLVRTIEEELAFVKDYLDINRLRFDDSFDYTIYIDPEVETGEMVPNMIIHTFVENAVKHGLLNLNRKGQLNISLLIKNGELHFIVEDNGIGREKAKILPTTSTGKGLKIFLAYCDYFNNFNEKKIRCDIVDLFDKYGEASGTRSEVIIPMNFNLDTKIKALK